MMLLKSLLLRYTSISCLFPLKLVWLPHPGGGKNYQHASKWRGREGEKEAGTHSSICTAHL